MSEVTSIFPGDKSHCTSKPKRPAALSEAGYANNGVSVKQAEAHARATFNQLSGGGKRGGPGRKN